MNATKTYEQLSQEAKELSVRTKAYAAVCEVVTYLTGKSYTTVFGGASLIKNKATRSQFVGVMCQFNNGKPVNWL